MKTLLSRTTFLMAFSMLGLTQAQASPLRCESVFSKSPVRSALVTSILEKRVQETLQLIHHRQVKDAPRSLVIDIEPVRRELFDTFYRTGLVEAGPLTERLSDKLVNAEVLRRLLGKEAYLHPRAIGLNKFLLEQKIIDASGKILKSEAEITAIFRKSFQQGFIIKPTEAEASHGEGLVSNANHAAKLIAQGDGSLWSAQQLWTPSVGPLSGKVGSGEHQMVMELIPFTGLADRNSPIASTNEFRVHVFDGQVVQGATIQRTWKETTDETFSLVNQRVQRIFNLLPAGYKARQAFSLDVFLLPEGEVRIIEVNTNSGLERTWSGFMRYPQVLASHIKMIEERYDWKFVGHGGELFRLGAANVKNSLGLRTLSTLKDFAEGKVKAEDIKPKLVGLYDLFSGPLKTYVQNGNKLSGESQNSYDFINEFQARLNSFESPKGDKWEAFEKWIFEEFQ